MKTKLTLACSKFAAIALLAMSALLGIPMLVEGQEKAPATEAVTVKNTRNLRYGEIIVIKPDGALVYNSTGLSDCPADKWDTMDTKKVKEEYGAVAVQKNGPQYWMMDSQTLQFGETKSFNGIAARYAATLDPAILKAEGGSKPYVVFLPKKTQRMVYSKGKPVFELMDPEGHAYVLQARKEAVPMESLPTLGEKLKQLPDGWKYRTRVLTEDLVLDLTADKPIHAVGDEFHQYYTRIPDVR